MITEPPILPGCSVLPPADDDPPPPPAKKPPKDAKRKAAGRFETLNKFVDFTVAELCRGDVAVWLILYRDTRDGTARTSQADIARRAGMSVRGVKVAIKRLQELGLLQVVYRGGINRGPSCYRVLPLTNRVTN